jgi:hypothetical protein
MEYKHYCLRHHLIRAQKKLPNTCKVCHARVPCVAPPAAAHAPHTHFTTPAAAPHGAHSVSARALEPPLAA